MSEIYYSYPEGHPRQVASLTLDITALCIIVIVEAALFMRLRFKVDFTGKLTLILHLVVAALRVYGNRLEAEQKNQFGTSPFDMLSVFTQALIWLSLYYFTFEMAYIRLALDSQSPKIFETKSYRVTVMKVVVLSLMLSMGMIQVFIIYLQCFQGDTVLAYPGLFDGIIYALRAVKFITDVYMYQLFVRQVVFFLRKKQQLEQEEI